MTFRRAKKDDGLIRLPLVALIDVTLFLLLYFIMAGSLAAAESQLTSAIVADRRGAGEGSGLASQVIRVMPGPEGVGVRVVLGQAEVRDRGALRALLEKLPQGPGIVVRVDDRVSVYAAAATLQTIRDAGFTKVSYVAGLGGGR